MNIKEDTGRVKRVKSGHGVQIFSKNIFNQLRTSQMRMCLSEESDTILTKLKSKTNHHPFLHSLIPIRFKRKNISVICAPSFKSAF